LKATVAQQQEEFRAKIAQQQTQIDALAAGLKEQVSKIHKVSDQLELTKSAPQLVANTP
jgi:septal ring factor EnvC (AmiA/AmiB activator)